MGWFSRLCRNVGLMVHNIRHPEAGEAEADQADRRVISRNVEEQTHGRTTLRRTTIDEIEIKPDRGDEP